MASAEPRAVASPEPRPTESREPRPAASPEPHGTGGLRLRDALVLGLLVAVVTAAVLAWAGSTGWVVAVGGLAAGALVPLAAWVARTVPGPGHPVQ